MKLCNWQGQPLRSPCTQNTLVTHPTLFDWGHPEQDLQRGLECKKLPLYQVGPLWNMFSFEIKTGFWARVMAQRQGLHCPPNMRKIIHQSLWLLTRPIYIPAYILQAWGLETWLSLYTVSVRKAVAAVWGLVGWWAGEAAPSIFLLLFNGSTDSQETWVLPSLGGFSAQNHNMNRGLAATWPSSSVKGKRDPIGPSVHYLVVCQQQPCLGEKRFFSRLWDRNTKQAKRQNVLLL